MVLIQSAEKRRTQLCASEVPIRSKIGTGNSPNHEAWHLRRTSINHGHFCVCCASFWLLYHGVRKINGVGSQASPAWLCCYQRQCHFWSLSLTVPKFSSELGLLMYIFEFALSIRFFWIPTLGYNIEFYEFRFAKRWLLASKISKNLDSPPRNRELISVILNGIPNIWYSFKAQRNDELNYVH